MRWIAPVALVGLLGAGGLLGGCGGEAVPVGATGPEVSQILPGPLAPQVGPQAAKLLICAHRGDDAHYPENTLLAYQQAIQEKAPMIEIDVRRTSDGQLVLMHDASVDRTTNGTGLVSQLTLAQIRALDAGSWKSSKFAGQRVPTLAQALSLFHSAGISPVIDIRPPEPTGTPSAIVAMVAKYGLTAKTTFICSSFSELAEVQGRGASLVVGWNAPPNQIPAPSSIDSLITRLQQKHIPVLWADYSVMTSAMIQRCVARGLTTNLWTVNSVTTAKSDAALGVKAIMTDYPNAMVPAFP